MGNLALLAAVAVAYYWLSSKADSAGSGSPSSSSTQAGTTNQSNVSTASNGGTAASATVQSTADVPFSVPVPVVAVPVTAAPVATDYGGTVSSASGTTFTDASGAIDFTNQEYLSEIRPYIASGDAPNFLLLYGTIFDPNRNPVLAQQMKDIASDVYSYFNQLQAAAPPNLTLQGLYEYYSEGLSPTDFMNWANNVKSGNPAQYNSWFISLQQDPMQDLDVTVQTDSGAYTIGDLVGMYDAAAKGLGWQPISGINIDASGTIMVTLANGNSGPYTPNTLLATIKGLQSVLSS